MNSAPHLLNEDRQDFDHLLDDALRIVLEERADTQGSGNGTGPGRGEPGDRRDGPHHALNSEQLRTMALGAADAIAGHAADEYAVYREVRERTRETARESARVRDSRTFGYAAMGVADGAGSGAGLVAVLAVLTPMLAGAAAAIFLLIGYSLHAMAPEPAIASPLRAAGWLFAAITGAAVLLGGIGLLLTALRNGSTAVHDSPDEMPSEVGEAREAWHQALLERGLLPFLDEAAANAALAPTPGHEPPATRGPAPASRMPRLGYSRPDFTSPAPDPTAPTSPASPRFQGPRYSSPDFSSPDFSSPDFSGPDFGSSDGDSR